MFRYQNADTQSKRAGISGPFFIMTCVAAACGTSGRCSHFSHEKQVSTASQEWSRICHGLDSVSIQHKILSRSWGAAEEDALPFLKNVLLRVVVRD
jgi:hypothetical protein